MQKLPDTVLDLIHKRVQHRPSGNDSNFNFIHQEDVFVIADLAYSIGKECAAKIAEAKPEQPTTAVG